MHDNLAVDGPYQDANYHYVMVGLSSSADADTARYGNAQEYGSSSMAAHPYVRPTLDSDFGKARSAMRDVFKEQGCVVTIWERIKDALTPLYEPMAANQYLVESYADLPDRFLVYQMVSDPPRQHADNLEVSRLYRVQVTIYDRHGLANLPDIEGAMLSAGFTRAGSLELPYNRQTRHYGLAADFFFLDEE